MTPSSTFTELDQSIHDRTAFASGREELDVFLQQFAVRHREAGISKTMVLSAKDNEADICAYYMLSHTEIERQTLPKALVKKLPRYPIPVMLIAQLAVHQEAQGQGLGKILLIRAL